MDNYFQIIAPYLRRLERTDTRAPIQHHNKVQRRGDEDARPEEDGQLFGDDVMVVSVAALQNLLKDLIGQYSGDGAREDRQNKSPQDRQAPDETPGAPPNRAAIGAYQHAAQTFGSSRERPVSFLPPNSDQSDPDQSGPKPSSPEQQGAQNDEDLRRAVDLLKKTEILQSQGIEDIHFKPGPDFLRSLEISVEELL